MSNIVDINKAKSKKPKAIKVKKEDSCMVIVKAWLPNYIKDTIKNDKQVIDYTQKWVTEKNTVGLKCLIMYQIENDNRVKFDDYKKVIIDGGIPLGRISSHTLSSVLKILLDKNILSNDILKELLLVDRFMFLCPNETFILPYTDKYKNEAEEIKGLHYMLKADDGSTVVCKMIIETGK